MKSERIIILLLVIILTACRSEQISTIHPTPLPSVVKTSTRLAPSPTQISTPTVTPSLTIETVPAETLSAVATLDAIRVDLVSRFPELQHYPVSCNSFSCYGIQTSPNGKRIVFTNGNIINLFETNGSKIGSYSFYDIYGYQIDYKEGSVEVSHWSNDGRYLYVSANPGGDGGPEPYFYYRSTLIRVNLENGTWKDTGISGSFEISPNDKYIIFSSNRSQVRVRNWATGQEQIYILPEDFLYFGNYVWSPDGRKVVFIGTPEDWDTEDSKFVMLMVDVESQAVHQLYETTLPFYYPVRWAESDKIILNRFSDWGEWILDISANPPTIISK